MKRICTICFLFFFFASCKEKPHPLSGDEAVTAKDFVAAFTKINLPYKLYDTNFAKAADTTNISYKVFTQFVPDSALTNLFGKNAVKMKINPVGSIEKENEFYLLADFAINKKNTLAVFVFDKKNKFLSALQLLPAKNDGYMHSVFITIEPTFIISREKTNADNTLIYTRNGFGYSSSSAGFITVMNDSNEDLKKNSEIINPIDTLLRKNKYSADYALDKKNFISLRDGKDAAHYAFFVHFEKNDGQCTGELKGVMAMRSDTKAYYQESGDACVIDFSFSGNTITVKEEGNCGNHRGIQCFFDDTYHKKKEPKPAKKK